MTKPLNGAKVASHRSSRTDKARTDELATAERIRQAFSPRDRVTHRMFGLGVVLQVDGEKLEIKFKTVGAKWIVDAFVRAG